MTGAGVCTGVASFNLCCWKVEGGWGGGAEKSSRARGIWTKLILT